MRIAGVNFPEPLLSALRDGRLVVFAGAGVSMGPPAKLPSFRRLAEQVAEGTGQSIIDGETEDRFLGRLEDRGTDVRQRVAQILQSNNPEPTALHCDLLRFFGNTEDVRVVTTNFDVLFEVVATGDFDHRPRVFQAAALPLGSRFRGIVHLHGSVNEPEEMVITHRDFGRAYLTEDDGWARRFIVALFANCTVLFVGYSHSDTIMTYLTPSLPPDDGQKRFALVGNKSDDLAHWRGMGIEPIVFPQADANDFGGLEAAVAGLADFMRRGVLDWQQTITAIANARPPIDDEDAGIIEYALTRPELTRFFVEAAVLPEWIDWLDRRGFLDRLFAEGDLGEQDGMLSYWLATRFAVAHCGELFSTMARRGGRLHSHLWNQLAWSLRDSEKAPPEGTVLAKWVHFLANSLPPQIDHYALSGLADICAKLGAYQNLLQVYTAMTASRYQVRPAGVWDASLNLHIRMEMLWERCLEPHLPHIAHSLLDRTTMRLEERHAAMTAWDQGNESWDADSYGRSAIEPHSQDDLAHEVDALVNVARGCLEWLALNDPGAVETWCDRLAGSSAPLLRRLTIHAMTARVNLSGDDKIAWLLESCDVNEFATHHEIFRAVSAAYPFTSEPRRRALIGAILEYRASDGGLLNLDPEIVAAHHHYAWFHWLHQADPDCIIAKTALDTIQECHPDFVAPKHPDFTHWSETVSGTSPWTAEELLAKPAGEWINDLLAFQPTGRDRVDGLGRWELLQAIAEAIRGSLAWGLDLADAVANAGDWDSDLWPHILMAWARTDFTAEETPRLLQHLTAGALHVEHAILIADALCHLVQYGEDSLSGESLLQANSIAVALRVYAPLAEVPNSIAYTGDVPHDMGWLFKANNHLAGKLALFWIYSISMWRKRQDPQPRSLSAEYRSVLDAIVGDDQNTGKLGRTVLASQFNFFLGTDETWALEHLLPLFDVEHKDFQCAWDGFLTWGRFSPPIAEHLRTSLIDAVQRIDHDFNLDMAMRFAEFYVAALGWLATGPGDEWITGFFKHAGGEAKRLFALQIGRRLRNLDEPRQQEWWDIWLKGYWENRLQGVPCPLHDEEIAEMLEWAIHLTGVFPEAIEVSSRMRAATLSRSHILHDVGETDLVDRYPNELTRFLIHLNQSEAEPWFWLDIRGIADKLLTKSLPADLELGLRELLALRDPR